MSVDYKYYEEEYGVGGLVKMGKGKSKKRTRVIETNVDTEVDRVHVDRNDRPTKEMIDGYLDVKYGKEEEDVSEQTETNQTEHEEIDGREVAIEESEEVGTEEVEEEHRDENRESEKSPDMIIDDRIETTGDVQYESEETTDDVEGKYETETSDDTEGKYEGVSVEDVGDDTKAELSDEDKAHADYVKTQSDKRAIEIFKHPLYTLEEIVLSMCRQFRTSYNEKTIKKNEPGAIVRITRYTFDEPGIDYIIGDVVTHYDNGAKTGEVGLYVKDSDDNMITLHYIEYLNEL